MLKDNVLRKNFLSALLGISIAGIVFGLITPVTVVILEKNSIDTWITGLLTTTGNLAFVVFSPFAAKLVDKLGTKKILLIGSVIVMLGSLGHIFWQYYYIIFPVKLITSLGSSFIFVATEVLINTCSDETNRGKNIGLYIVLLSVGIACGTLLIWTERIFYWVPFVIGAAVMLTVFITQLFMIREIKPVNEIKKQEKMPFKKMPLLGLMSSVWYGLFEAAVIVAIPIYALRLLMTENDVSILLGSFVIGGITLLYFISRLSDKYSPRKVLLIISLVLFLLFIVPVFNTEFIMLIILFFIIGGILPSYYSIGLNYTMGFVNKKCMAQANGYYIMMYGIGTIIGPLAGAMMVELNIKYGFWVFASALSLIYFLLFILPGTTTNNKELV